MPSQVRNRTKYKLRLDGAEQQQVLLAPFEQRTLSDDEFESFNETQMTRHALVGVEEVPTAERVSSVFGFGIFAIVLYAVAGFLIERFLFWALGAVAIVVGLAIALVGVRRGWLEVVRWFRQLATLLIVLAIGIGIPVLAVWYSSSLADFPVTLRNFYDLVDIDESRRLAIARALQVAFIIIASLLPALMYYLFDRARLATLRDRFVHQIFRLDRTLVTESDLVAKYGSQMEETYGSRSADSAEARFAGGRRSPVIVGTLLITIGWTFILLNPSVGLVSIAQGTTVVAPFGILELFTPQQSAVAFAFLGGYFYALRVILRGYVRGDLKPKTYTNIAVRLILVVVLAWVLEGVFTEPTWAIYPIAFLAGIVPDTWLRSVADKVSRLPLIGSSSRDQLSEELRLNKLEGIDLYDQGRLEEEGVSNIEALAHADLVDLMLRTRIPVPQLVDWVDQAILFLHTYETANEDERPTYDRLKLAGIRTATDLMQAKKAAAKRNALDEFLDRFDENGSQKPPTIQIVLDTFSDEEWLDDIGFWHVPTRRTRIDLPGTHVEGDIVVVICDTVSPRLVIQKAYQNPAQAEEILREGLRDLPDHLERPLLLAAYGNLVYESGLTRTGPDARACYNTALEAYDDALELDNELVMARANRALVLFTLGRDEEAKQEIDTATEANAKPIIDLEMQFYLYALVPEDRTQRLGRVVKLLDSGIRSPGWPLQEIVHRAESEDKSHGAEAASIAAVIRGDEPWETVRPSVVAAPVAAPPS